MGRINGSCNNKIVSIGEVYKLKYIQPSTQQLYVADSNSP